MTTYRAKPAREAAAEEQRHLGRLPDLGLIFHAATDRMILPVNRHLPATERGKPGNSCHVDIEASVGSTPNAGRRPRVGQPASPILTIAKWPQRTNDRIVGKRKYTAWAFKGLIQSGVLIGNRIQSMGFLGGVPL